MVGAVDHATADGATLAEHQLDTAVDVVVEATGDDSPTSGANETLLELLAKKLTDRQLFDALERTRKAATNSSSGRQGAFAALLSAAAPRLADPNTFEMLLGGMEYTTNGPYLRTLSDAVRSLTPALSEQQAEAGFARMLGKLGQVTDTDQLRAFGETLQLLAPKLALPQTEKALIAVLVTASKQNYLLRLANLASTARTLGSQLPEEQRLQAVLATIHKVDPSDVGVLPEVVDAALAAPAEVPDFDTSETDDDRSTKLETLIRALLPRLGQPEIDQVIAAARSGLAWAETPAQAEGWARILVMMLPQKPQSLLADAVEALKYPTAIETAEDVLLEAIRTKVPEAPDEQRGRRALVEWVADNYGSIVDVDAPPTCPPPPPDSSLTCPGTTGAGT